MSVSTVHLASREMKRVCTSRCSIHVTAQYRLRLPSAPLCTEAVGNQACGIALTNKQTEYILYSIECSPRKHAWSRDDSVKHDTPTTPPLGVSSTHTRSQPRQRIPTTLPRSLFGRMTQSSYPQSSPAHPGPIHGQFIGNSCGLHAISICCM